MKWLFTCFLVIVGPALAAAQEYIDFEGLKIGQTIEEVQAVVDGRGGLKLKGLPMPDAIHALAPMTGRPAGSIDVRLIVDAGSALEPAVAMVAFEKETGRTIWLYLYSRWLGLGSYGQRMTVELISKKYGIASMQPDNCETNLCFVGQAPTGEIIMVTPNSNIRVLPPPG